MCVCWKGLVVAISCKPPKFWSMVTQYNFMMMSSKNLTGLYSHPVVKLTEKPQTHQTNIKDLAAIKADC